jgi:carboxyl-terminal processing protease
MHRRRQYVSRMEVPRENSAPSFGERSARTAVGVFLLLAIVTLAFGLGYLLSDESSSSSSTPGKPVATVSNADPVGAAIINEIYDILKNDYVDRSSLDPDTIKRAAINGVITSLNDPHTTYLTPADLKAGDLDLSSTFQGIGASISDSTGQVQVVAPIRETPAEAAGVKSGDIILEVDGAKTDGWSAQEAVQKIRGPKGTPVKLTIKHTDGKTEILTIIRGDIPLESVFSEPNLEVIPGESGKKLVDRDGKEATDIAYINVSEFREKTHDELVTKLRAISGKGYVGLILDLRGDSGGLLTAALDVSDEFLDTGTIVSQKDADGKTTSARANPGGLATKIPIVVLQDQSSASGSEILAGALHDNGRAKIVGTRSFGKGTVNQLQPLTKCGDPNGCGALYLSVGRWFTPNGDQIEGVGIKPDVELPMTSDDYINSGDIQVFKAIDILRGK